MKVFEKINTFFVKYPFLFYIIIIVGLLIPYIIKVANHHDAIYQKERAAQEKQKVCVDTTVTVKPDLVYVIRTCSDEHVEITAINGKPVEEGENT